MSRKSTAAQQADVDTDAFGPPVRAADPLDINVRLYRQVSDLLAQLEIENVDIKTRYMALMAIARMQAVFVALRKEKFDDPGRGSSVRKYAATFKAHGARGRKAVPGPADEPDDTIDALISGADDDDID